MKKILVVLLFLLLTGCTSAPTHKIILPEDYTFRDPASLRFEPIRPIKQNIKFLP